MRLSQKLALAQLCLIGAILVAYAVFQFAWDLRIFESDMTRDHHAVGVILRDAAANLWRQGHSDRALRSIARADTSGSGMDVSWVPLESEGQPDGAASGAMPLVAAAWAESLRQGRELVRIEPGAERPGVRVTYVPVSVDGRVPGAIRISESLAEERRFARTTILHILLTATVIAGGGVLFSLALGARWIVRPVEGLVGQARRIGSGDLSQRASVGGQDEIGALAREMNQMADQLEDSRVRLVTESNARIATLEQLRHADRLATVGTLASGIAHELGTPLNVVTARARLIETGATDPEEASDGARIIREQGERMTRIIRQLLDFSRKGETAQKIPVDLRETTRQILALLGPYAQKRKVTLALVEERWGPAWARVDQEQIKQVLVNLVMNGIQAMPSPGSVTVAAESRELRPPPEIGGLPRCFACVEVTDEGCGITGESVSRIFDPFYTTKAVGEGTGLGLSVSYGIIREHGGWIEVTSEPGRGSTFRICLPGEGEPCADAS
jgi:two-component system, NtrC family, sensor kinase